MTTNWAAVREAREDYGLSAPDESGPQRIIAALAELGLAATEKDGLVLLAAEGRQARETFVAFVSGNELFTWGEEQEAKRARKSQGRLAFACDSFERKLRLWQNEHEAMAGPHAYLYVVDLDNALAREGNQDVAVMLEHDVRGVRKLVCTPQELPAMLANPFGQVFRGVCAPQFEVQRMDRLSFEPPVRDFVETVTHLFARERDMGVWLERLHAHPDCPRVTALANTLVRRVMGRDMQLIEGSDEVLFDRAGHKHTLPWFAIGSGEQVGLAFCIFTALAAEEAAPPTWLGFTDVVNYLDLSHYLLALDVLRDLAIATGTSVYVKTNKEDYRRLAQGKLERAAECLGCSV